MPISIQMEDFATIETEWIELLEQGNVNTVFLTPQWLRVWWDQFGQDAQLCLATVRKDKRILGIAPLMCQTDVLTFIGSSDLSDYQDFVVANGSEAEVYPALVQHIDSQSWNLLDLGSIPQASPTLENFPELLQQRGYLVNIEDEDVAPRVELPETWEEYLSALRKKDRHELRRKMRRLDERTQYSYRTGHPDYLEEDLAKFFSLMRGSREEKEHFLTSVREQFFRGVAKEMTDMGVLRLFFLEIDDRPVAAALTFDYDNTRLLYNSGYDQDYASMGVGVMLTALCLKDAIKSRRRYFDFLRGSESYKYHLGGQNCLIRRLRAQRT